MNACRRECLARFGLAVALSGLVYVIASCAGARTSVSVRGSAFGVSAGTRIVVDRRPCHQLPDAGTDGGADAGH